MLVYFLFFRDKNQVQVVEKIENTTEEIIPNQENNSVTAFVAFVRKDESMGIDHEYTNEALSKLVEATKAVADKHDYTLSPDLDQINEHTDHITNDPYETSHANHIRKAADVLTSELQKMQEAKFPNLSSEAGEVKQASSSIEPSKLTLDQKEQAKTFFREAADLLEKMNS